jgi:phosphatidylglycerol:prolipoprotein diacylglycerol transferase
MTLGTWKLHANLIFFIISCAAGVFFGIRKAREIEGLPSYSKSHLIIGFLIGIMFAYLLGRLNGGLFTVISQNFNWEVLSYGGLISFGAILGGLFYGFLISRIFRFSTLKILDLIALILPLMESIYRIGCILMGCCYGRQTDGFGGVYLPEVHGVWAYRYPTQIALMIFNLLLFLYLWKRSKEGKRVGSQVLIFLIIYCVGRFIIDFFRGDMPMVGILGYHQIQSFAIFCLTLLAYACIHRIKRI